MRACVYVRAHAWAGVRAVLTNDLHDDGPLSIGSMPLKWEIGA